MLTVFFLGHFWGFLAFLGIRPKPPFLAIFGLFSGFRDRGNINLGLGSGEHKFSALIKYFYKNIFFL